MPTDPTARLLARQLQRDVVADDLDARVVWRGRRPYAVTRVGTRSEEVPLPENLLFLPSDTIRTLLARAAHANAEKLRTM